MREEPSLSSGAPWRTISFRLKGLALALLLATVGLLVANLYIVGALRAAVAWMQVMNEGPALGYRLAITVERLQGAPESERPALRAEVGRIVEEMRERYRVLLSGDPQRGIRGALSPELEQGIRRRFELFEQQLVPRLRILEAGGTTAVGNVAEELASETREAVERAANVLDQRVGWFRAIQLGFGLLLVGVALTLLTVALSIVGRLRTLATTAARIASGELTIDAAIPGRDEVAALGASFDAMTRSLREKIVEEERGREQVEALLAAVRNTVNQLSTATAEIAAAAKQQAAASQEQASAVYQSVSAADQVARTADEAASRADAVARSAQRSDTEGKAGRKALEEAVAVLGRAKTQSDSLAESILSLAERTQAIGDIVSAITEIADQTNILALNAAIEAARAGESGRGFSVVAGEVRTLADQSKQATVQVRQILGEIQRMANRAVLATEDGTRSMSAAVEAAQRTGDTLLRLLDAIAEWAQAAAQISQGARQQAVSIGQINQGIKSISDATSQTLGYAKQTEQAARDLNGLGTTLKQLLQKTRT